MDEFLDELPSDLYLEWMAFDSVEPLDAAGTILKGFSGGKEQQPQSQGAAHWMNQKMQMLQWHKLFGKKK